MKGEELDSEHHVVRYVNSTCVADSGKAVTGRAFHLRLGEDFLSVNWLEACGSGRNDQLAEVRRTCRMGRRSTVSRRKRDIFAEINIGELKRALSEELYSSRIIHDPQDATEEHCADPSHAIITGLPPHGSADVVIIGELIAECVSALHPVITPQDD